MYVSPPLEAVSGQSQKADDSWLSLTRHSDYSSVCLSLASNHYHSSGYCSSVSSDNFSFFCLIIFCLVTFCLIIFCLVIFCLINFLSGNFFLIIVPLSSVCFCLSDSSDYVSSDYCSSVCWRPPHFSA